MDVYYGYTVQCEVERFADGSYYIEIPAVPTDTHTPYILIDSNGNLVVILLPNDPPQPPP